VQGLLKLRGMIAPIAARHVVLVTTHHASDFLSLAPSVLDIIAAVRAKSFSSP